VWAAVAYLGAVFSKEAALPLPLVLAVWAWAIDRDRPARVAMRLAPFLAVAMFWAGVALTMRARHPHAAAFLHWDPTHFVAGYVHQIQSLLGLEHPAGMLASLAVHGPALLPWLLLGAAALALRASHEDAAPFAKQALWFAIAWLVGFGLVTGPVASTWSAYYYTLSAVGGALLVGMALQRIRGWGWVILIGGLLWWHAGSSGTRAFAIADRPWGWTSHLTAFYFQRAASLTETLREELKRVEPHPPPEARLFFATLPPWAGFQMGNGALVRDLYRDTTIQSYFYSQFSESTAAWHPSRFLYWDGRDLRPLYRRQGDFFQVGTDLLLLDKAEGAVHAFRRALAAGGNRDDNLYWMGWALLWSGDRARAEAAWKELGAHDDPTLHLAFLGEARRALDQRDTLQARRALAVAIQYGIGEPMGHAVLGPLLMARFPKYGMLELAVTVWLKPNDWLARRDLLVGLVNARLDEPARGELAILMKSEPAWQNDSTLVAARRTLEARTLTNRTAVEL
jgi:hypothetical protein